MRSLVALFAAIAVLTTSGQAQQIPPHPTLPECQADDPTLMKPDLIPEVPSDVRTLTRGSYRQLEFTTAVGNLGPGPLILEGKTVSNADGIFTVAYQHINRTDGTQCAHTAGLFVYHPQHKHWHFDRFVGYELRRDDPYSGELVGGGEKMSFCLLDIRPLRGFNPLTYQRQVLTMTCNTAEGIYGISTGWEDVYEHFLPGQAINLDPDRDHQVPPGAYFLVNRVNPDGRIWEASLDNNTSFTSVGVAIPAPAFAATPPPTPTVGPAKNPQLPHMRPPRVRPTRPPRSLPVKLLKTPAVPVKVHDMPTPTPTTTTPIEVPPTATPISARTKGPHQPHAPLVPKQPR